MSQIRHALINRLIIQLHRDEFDDIIADAGVSVDSSEEVDEALDHPSQGAGESSCQDVDYSMEESS